MLAMKFGYGLSVAKYNASAMPLHPVATPFGQRAAWGAALFLQQFAKTFDFECNQGLLLIQIKRRPEGAFASTDGPSNSE
ncbi:MAG: hypothetical protein V4857_04575 [Pseudomonadota bacterium]